MTLTGFLFLGVFFEASSSSLFLLPPVPLAVAVGVLGVFFSSSSDEELSDELLSGFGLAVALGVLFAAGVVFTGTFLVFSSSELSSLEDDDSAAFETGVFATGVLGVAVLVKAVLAGGVFGASASESELSELLLSAFFVLVGVTAGLGVAAGFPLVFSSSSLELSESLLLDSAAGLVTVGVALDALGVAALALGVEITVLEAGLALLVAEGSSSELSLSELELLSAA